MDVLKIEMGRNDAGAKTVGEYLTKLLTEVLVEGEGFSGKRPFGNSGWESELAYPLVKAGLIEGSIDPLENEAWDVDYEEMNEILVRAIRDKLM